ncbi:hypothetical protein Poli38472_008126 [Pythium oligandrum]|uniref:Uncharacterized protein n=1 Tax=Pythium oligandrum TaxID=41045 RepID=A0A8K1CL18_PYTOL|nr:hypothetical protein Poli38472_008126 [Pythium oligandrum]|eukprot:TMW65484.1 hypothetical protein Poli38472_008126 [Pythium oligandrum]
MEDRLAHVLRLVKERWVAVEEMRRENEALRHRQQTLVRHFQTEVLSRRVASGLHMASVEKTVHADRQAVAHLEEELTRKQTANAKCRRHILRLRCLNDELARVRKEEEENVQVMRDEWDQDKAVLEEIGRKDEEKRSDQARQRQQRLQQMQRKVDEVEAIIAAKKVNSSMFIVH